MNANTLSTAPLAPQQDFLRDDGGLESPFNTTTGAPRTLDDAMTDISNSIDDPGLDDRGLNAAPIDPHALRHLLPQKEFDLSVSTPACGFLFFRTTDFNQEVTTHVERCDHDSMSALASSFSHGGLSTQSTHLRYNCNGEPFSTEFKLLSKLFNRYSIQYLGDIRNSKSFLREHVLTFPVTAHSLNFFTIPSDHLLPPGTDLWLAAMGK